jgi:hypothetical protein
MTNLTTKWLDSRNINYTISAAGLIYVDGDIDIAAGESVALDGVAEVSGHVSVRGGASLTAAALAKCGYVDVWEGASLTLDALAKSGDVSVRKGASLTAAALAECGSVSVWEGATLTANALTKCGDVYVWEGATLTAAALAECGYVYVGEGASLTLDALAKSGYVDVRKGASLTANALTKCGYVYVREGATLTANALATVSHLAYNTDFLNFKVEVFDGIGCVVTSTKTRDDITIRSCRKAAFKDGELVGNRMYVVSQGDHNAHGETLESALDDLSFKTADRDMSKYRDMPADTVKTPHEWAVVYRVVTGACQYGTEQFIKQKGNLKARYTLTEIIEETRGAYGSERFRDVVGD